MKTVFIGGSRRVTRLNDRIRAKLAEIAERKLNVLIGDANGADRAVRAQFAAWNYPNVTVHFVGTKPRNNEGAWSLSQVAASSKTKDFEFFAAKDRQMAHDADCGLMIWDGESRGTLANVHNLAAELKPVAVYLSKQRRFINVIRPDDLRLLFSSAHITVARKAGTVQVEQPELPLAVPASPSASIGAGLRSAPLLLLLQPDAGVPTDAKGNPIEAP
jgi:adenine-specific DNA-methyltransferase